MTKLPPNYWITAMSVNPSALVTTGHFSINPLELCLAMPLLRGGYGFGFLALCSNVDCGFAAQLPNWAQGVFPI